MSNHFALVVEDRPDWQQIIGKALDSMDWQYHIAADYDGALHLLRENFFDMAIIDPVLDNDNKYNRDGLRVLADIHSQFPEMSVVIVSGSVSAASLVDNPDIPKDIPLIEKHHWDRDLFKKTVLEHAVNVQTEVGDTTLRMKIQDEAQKKRKTDEMPAFPNESERIGVPRILIVEDRPDWQIILANAIENEGWFWRVVDDALAALNMLEDDEKMFHVVLLDLRLGDADVPLQKGTGWQLLEHISRGRMYTRVIIVSGEASGQDVARLFTQYPIAGFIDKDSFKRSDLLEIIHKVTEKPQIRFQTLGSFQLWRDEEPIDDFLNEKNEQLLKILLTMGGQSISSDDLNALLFPEIDATGDPDHVALENVVDSTRYLLEPELASPNDSVFIIKNEERYTMNINQYVNVDFLRLETMLAEGKKCQHNQDHERARLVYHEAVKLYDGEYLPNDRFAQWTIAQRNHMQTVIARIMNRLADIYAQRANLDKAIEIAEACLVHDAYHESTHRRLMRYHFCNGNKDEAITVYYTLKKLLNEFFAEDPDTETEALFDAIAADDLIKCTEQLG